MDDAELLAQIKNGGIAPNPKRASILLALAALVGLDPPDPRYVDAIYPYESDRATARQLALHQSGCGLVTEAGWRAVPVDEPLLYSAVGPRSAAGGREYPVALERADAILWDAWVGTTTYDDRVALPLLPGDAWIIGNAGGAGVWSKGTGKYEHEFTVAFFDPETGDLWSIDGGQPGIRVRRRKLVAVPDKKELWVGSVDADGVCALDPADMRPRVGRRVLGAMDADRLKVQLAA